VVLNPFFFLVIFVVQICVVACGRDVVCTCETQREGCKDRRGGRTQSITRSRVSKKVIRSRFVRVILAQGPC
jgi:hypothetical protein